MRLQKILAFLLSFALSLVLTFGRRIVLVCHSDGATQTQGSTTVVAYALAIPADVPGLSPKSDREQEQLLGPVKAVSRVSISTSKLLGLFTRQRSQLISALSFTLEGNKTEEIDYNTGGASIYRISYSYDGNRRKTTQVMSQGNIHGQTTYSYKQEGRELEALEQVGEKNNLVKRRYIATYDSQGKQIEARYSEGDMELKASYRYSSDDQGHLVELATLDDKGFIYHRVVYSYDEKGNRASELAYRPDGQLYKKSLFSYEGKKKREEKFSYSQDGPEYLHLVEIYDDRGNLIEVFGFDRSGEISGGKTIRTYEYDQVGNWIKQTVQSVDAVAGTLWGEWVEERTIEYY